MNPEVGDVRARTSGLSRWHERQSLSCSIFRESVSCEGLMPAISWRWQVRQLGAPATPAANACPCADCPKASFTSAWHSPHETGRFDSLNLLPGTFGDATSCVPWQSLHETSGSSWAASAAAIWGWKECFTWTPPWQVRHLTGSIFSLCGTLSGLNPVGPGAQEGLRGG